MADRNKLNEVKKLLKAEMADEAKKLFDKLESQETAEYFLLEGAIAQKFQNHGAAINAYNKVLEIDPGNLKAQNNLHLVQNILNFWNPDMYNP